MRNTFDGFIKKLNIAEKESMNLKKVSRNLNRCKENNNKAQMIQDSGTITKDIT